MKRIGMGLGAVLLAVLGSMTTLVHAGTSDFTISRFDAQYYLGSDGEGRSTLKTVERITAEFPQIDQNHGIERAVPKTYDGHSTSLKIQSVTDDNGQRIDYSSSTSNGNEVLRIGDTNTYVHGSKIYVITYTERDVTKYFADVGDDEFYWDINGTQWQQPFGEVSATIHLSDSIRPTLSKKMACYQGREGSTQSCTITGDRSAILASTKSLNQGENMTIAIGFGAGTFRAYQMSMWDKIVSVLITIWIISTMITSIAAVVLLFILSYWTSLLSNRKKDIGTVVAEYIPPKGRSVLTSMQIGEGTRSEMTAQIIDLAVRHYMKIYQTRDRSFMKPAEYELEIIKSIDDLTQEEKKFVTILFGTNGTAVGARLAMKTLKSDYKRVAELRVNAETVGKLIKGKYGLRHKDDGASRRFKTMGWWLLAIGIVTLSPLMIIAAVVAFVCVSQLYPLTDKGLALRRYLMGLKLYIGVAEEERLKMLQSPEGAEKVGQKVGSDTKQLVKLYERVLPYAVLFGQEKEWNKQLGVYYELNGTNPDWYSGNAAFNAVVFTTAMNDFSTTISSYATSTSSSNGGSNGGGFSAGGGGGGGGGGW